MDERICSKTRIYLLALIVLVPDVQAANYITKALIYQRDAGLLEYCQQQGGQSPFLS